MSAENKENKKIDQMDTALENYYKSLGRDDYRNEDGDGKFKLYCDNNGFANGDMEEELGPNSTMEASQCLFVDFDQGPDGVPLDDNGITSDEERLIAVLNLLKHIYKHGEPPSQNAIQSKLSIMFDIPKHLIANAQNKIFKKQLSHCIGGFNELDLLHFFAVGHANDIPFLTYMVDAFTLDQAKHYFDGKQEQTMTLQDWIQSNAFFKQLTECNPELSQKLKMAMTAYTTRVMPRLSVSIGSRILVNDNISEIVDYVVAIPHFIKILLNDSANISPPFCIDVLFAVQEVVVAVNDEEDSKEEAKDPEYDPNIDHIGNVQERLKSNGCVCTTQTVPDTVYQFQPSQQLDKEAESKLIAFRRFFDLGYKEFRATLSKTKPHDEFNSSTYPNGKRFGIFVDRRQTEQRNAITFFEQIPSCDSIPRDHVAEWYMETARECLIPGTKGNENEKITSMDGVCGQLITFSFHVEAADEIKCYLIWNKQTMLFKGDNLADILSHLFIENKEAHVRKDINKQLSSFDEQMTDARFELFHQKINNGYLKSD
eukprot:806494_1